MTTIGTTEQEEDFDHCIMDGYNPFVFAKGFCFIIPRLANFNFLISNMKILALSSSRMGNGGFLEWAVPLVSQFMGNNRFNIAFVPFASVQKNYQEYGDMVQQAFRSLSCSVATVVSIESKPVLENADMIMVGGGNTFKLLHDIYEQDLFEIIQKKVRTGTPYIGWSAGANIAGRTISTTNDMPIIEPKSFASFAFLPFQINPHYINQKIDGHNGETRDQRIEEFVMLNPGIPVVGLPEGTALQLQDFALRFVGEREGVLFQTNANSQTSKKKILSGEDISMLLFDQ